MRMLTAILLALTIVPAYATPPEYIQRGDRLIAACAIDPDKITTVADAAEWGYCEGTLQAAHEVMISPITCFPADTTVASLSANLISFGKTHPKLQTELSAIGLAIQSMRAGYPCKN